MKLLDLDSNVFNACISKAYVEKHWVELFDICEYVDDGKFYPQNVICRAQKNVRCVATFEG